MAELTKDMVEQWLLTEDYEFYLDKFREKHSVDPTNSNFYKAVERLVLEKKLKRLRRGLYKQIKHINPVKIFSVKRERRPPFELFFPCDYDTRQPFPFNEDVVIREGDCILIAGFSNYGKTALAVNFLGENIDYNPALLGNEFTKDDEPTPRFLNRLDAMDWVNWVDDEGEDKFTLLPVYDDFEEYIIKNRINIVDWINLRGEYYMISNVMEDIKRAVGDGIAILVIQKNEDKEYGRGGAPTKDFADLELLIDSHGENESRLTVGKTKETHRRITGRSWAYGIAKGVKLTDIREVVKCPRCYGKKWVKFGNSSKPCDCRIGWIDK